jgi:hypothetical protein
VSLVRGEPEWLRYYSAFCWHNYSGMLRALRS